MGLVRSICKVGIPCRIARKKCANRGRQKKAIKKSRGRPKSVTAYCSACSGAHKKCRRQARIAPRRSANSLQTADFSGTLCRLFTISFFTFFGVQGCGVFPLAIGRLDFLPSVDWCRKGNNATRDPTLRDKVEERENQKLLHFVGPDLCTSQLARSLYLSLTTTTRQCAMIAATCADMTRPTNIAVVVARLPLANESSQRDRQTASCIST